MLLMMLPVLNPLKRAVSQIHLSHLWYSTTTGKPHDLVKLMQLFRIFGCLFCLNLNVQFNSIHSSKYQAIQENVIFGSLDLSYKVNSYLQIMVLQGA